MTDLAVTHINKIEIVQKVRDPRLEGLRTIYITDDIKAVELVIRSYRTQYNDELRPKYKRDYYDDHLIPALEVYLYQLKRKARKSNGHVR